jgi:hypothetical protein
MKNIIVNKIGTKLTIEIDLTASVGVSAELKSETVASSEGHVVVATDQNGQPLKLTLSVNRPLSSDVARAIAADKAELRKKYATQVLSASDVSDLISQ